MSYLYRGRKEELHYVLGDTTSTLCNSIQRDCVCAYASFVRMVCMIQVFINQLAPESDREQVRYTKEATIQSIAGPAPPLSPQLFTPQLR